MLSESKVGVENLPVIGSPVHVFKSKQHMKDKYSSYDVMGGDMERMMEGGEIMDDDLLTPIVERKSQLPVFLLDLFPILFSVLYSLFFLFFSLLSVFSLLSRLFSLLSSLFPLFYYLYSLLSFYLFSPISIFSIPLSFS